MKFINRIVEESRLLTVLYENLPVEVTSSSMYTLISDYLEKYCVFNSMLPTDVVEVYTGYISAYNKHCKQFIKHKKYPIELGLNDYVPTRVQYDIVLILSALITAHRHSMMEMISHQSTSDQALFIGLGPGLELAINKKKHTEIHAYDLSINPFLRYEFKDVHFNDALYTGQKTNYFDSIYLIEILEHLTDPYDLLHICHQSLKTGGSILLTTATDIPQFDHLFNFPIDHSDFESKLAGIGFVITKKERLDHQYLTLDFSPCNHFYTIQKI